MEKERRNILIVEDEPITAMLEKKVLERYGYKVLTVNTGERAIEAVGNTHGIDLILMDIDLGDGMDGTETASIISREKNIPIVFLSSHTEPEIVEKTEKVTSYGYIVKGTGDTVLDAGIKMAFKLFETKNKLENELKERKRFENRLQEKEALFQKMLHVVPDMISIHDIEMNILYSNWNGFASIPEEKRDINTKCYKTYRGFDDICPDCQAKTVIDTKEAFQTDAELPDGTWVDLRVIPIFNDNGKMEMFVEWVRDITEHKKAEEMIRESEQSLSITLQSIGDAVIATDIYGNISRMNKTAEIMTGWSKKDAMGIPLDRVFNIINSENREKVENPVKKVLEHGKVVGLANHTVLISRDGREYHISDSAAPIIDNNGNICGIVMVFSNITEKYRHEKDLKDSEERFRALHNASFGGIAIHDKGLILECNKGLSVITGYSLDELIGMNGLLLIAEGSRDMVMDKILSGYEKPYEAMGVRKNGEEYPIRLEARNIPYKNKNVRVVEFRDITEIKEYEKQLKTKTEILENITDNMHDLVSLTDLDGNFKFVGRSHNILGYERDSLLGKNVMEFVHPEDLPGVISEFKDFIRIQKKAKSEYRYRCADGSYLWFETVGIFLYDSDNKPKEILFNTRDITERKKMEMRLEESEEKHRRLFETMSPGVIYQAKDGRVISANPASERILGISLHDLMGKTSKDPRWKMIKTDGTPVPPDEHPAMEALNTGKKTGPVKRGIFIPEKDEYVWLSITAIPLFKDGEDEPYQAYAVFDDITDSVKAENEIKHQLKEKETLLREVHHRIKNNLFSIESLLLLQKESSRKPEIISAFHSSISRVQSMRVLYDKLLMENEYEKISVKTYIESLVDIIISIFPQMKKLKVTKDIMDFEMSPKSLFPIGIIVNELITNALKYAFIGREQGSVEISMKKDDEEIILIIQDDGIGICTEDLKENGSGFGINLVRMLTEQLDGNFHIEKQNGTKNILKFCIY